MNWLGIGGFTIALIGLFITVIKMWFTFQNEFENHKTQVKLKLQEYEMKTNALIMDMKEFKDSHDEDIKLLTSRFQADMNTIHRENREDHSKIFTVLDSVGKTLTKLETTLDLRKDKKE